MYQYHLNGLDLMSKDSKMAKENIAESIYVLKTIYDPEIPVDIYELGLIYEIKIDDEINVGIDMTLTSPNCPVVSALLSLEAAWLDISCLC